MSLGNVMSVNVSVVKIEKEYTCVWCGAVRLLRVPSFATVIISRHNHQDQCLEFCLLSPINMATG